MNSLIARLKQTSMKKSLKKNLDIAYKHFITTTHKKGVAIESRDTEQNQGLYLYGSFLSSSKRRIQPICHSILKALCHFKLEGQPFKYSEREIGFRQNVADAESGGS